MKFTNINTVGTKIKFAPVTKEFSLFSVKFTFEFHTIEGKKKDRMTYALLPSYQQQVATSNSREKYYSLYCARAHIECQCAVGGPGKDTAVVLLQEPQIFTFSLVWHLAKHYHSVTIMRKKLISEEKVRA